MRYKNIFILVVVFLTISMRADAREDKLGKCLFVTSYHKGYAWQDGIEKGLRSVLEGKCEIRQFDMDTKRNPSPEFCRQKALEAKALIESWKPDIVIASDDNASKYLVAPYFKDAKLPFVFCGVNWTAEEYGYPYSNVTGMIEISPIRPMIKALTQIMPGAKTGACLIPDRLTPIKSAQRLKKIFDTAGITLSAQKVNTMDDFKKKFIEAQDADFIMLLNNSGVNDWDKNRAGDIVLKHSRKLTLTLNRWMMPYAMLGMTTVPEEQGEYAAEVALNILEGNRPGDIPVIANRKRDTYVNKTLLKTAGISLPTSILQQAKTTD
ncbi:ABC transporter substrate binding protein [Desulfobacterales bacterium HSG16]|nr:ABC transporter substrate binding protein [Desulfobacterales bacterium HSG16]